MGQEARVFEQEIIRTLRLDYLLYLPSAYAEGEEDWPLMLFLHGAGERGHDLDQVAEHGPPRLVAAGNRELPFVMVSPQCPAGDWWTSQRSLDSLTGLLDDVIRAYRIDEDRIYLTGLSMGGHGTWALAAADPNRFAALAPICGAGDPDEVPRIAHLPAWVFHGAQDDVVPLQKSQAMVTALKARGCDVRLTVYPDAGHDSWTETYDSPDLYDWFLSHTRSGT